MKPITREEQYLYKLTGEETIIPEKPITREEQYLSRLCGKDNVIPQAPITRIEQYLAHLCGEEVAIPEKPITRLEQYMAFAAGEAETKPTPITRQEMLWDKYNGGFVPEEKTVDWTPVISVSDALAKPVVDYQFKITAKQTGTPSPQNICPIDGWSDGEITRAGKNLLALPIYNRRNTTKPEMFWLPKGEYMLSWEITNATNWRPGAWLYDKDGNSLSDSAYKPNTGWNYYSNPGYWLNGANTTRKYATISIVESCYVRFFIGLGDTTDSTVISNGQLEVGQTATAYAPYETPTVYPVSWLSEAGTVYGGVLDVTTGTLTVTHASLVLDGSESGWNTYVSRDGFSKQIYGMKSGTYMPFLCDTFKTATSYGETSIKFGAGNSAIYMLSIVGSVEGVEQTTTSWRDWLHDHPITIVYELAEPITYTLTPTEITLTEGANTIWADCGDSKLTYLARAAENVRKMNATLAKNNAILKSGGKIIAPVIEKPIVKKV